MLNKYKIIHRSCWMPKMIIGVSWDFFLIWLIAAGVMLPLCFKVFYLAILIIILIITSFLLARYAYKHDPQFFLKLQKYASYQNYYPAVAKFSSSFNTVTPKTYFYDERFMSKIIKLLNKLLTKNSNNDNKIHNNVHQTNGLNQKNKDNNNDDYSNPYLNGRREWLERYGDYITQNIFWRRSLLIALCVIIILSIIIAKLATSYKVEAELFALSPNGAIQAVTSLNQDYVLNNTSIISNQLQDYIIALRTINNDIDLLSRYQHKLLAMTDSALFKKTIDPILQQNLTAADKIAISIHISYVYPNGKYDKEKNNYNWVIMWNETAYNIDNNTPINTTYWMANITLGFFTPQNNQTIHLNPTSILIEKIQINSMVSNDKQSLDNQIQSIPNNIAHSELYSN